nr:carbohydrate ABC transporter permease [uncultured Acetatifactor sp.]
MIEKHSKSRILFLVFNYTFMILFALACFMPLWHVLMASVSAPHLLMGSSGLLLKPLGKLTLEGYELVMHSRDILTGYINTIAYVLAVAVAGSFLTAIAGYLISRKGFRLAKPLTIFIMFTMMFSGGIIPTYMVVRGLGLLNTRGAVIFPSLMNAYFIIMMKSSFEQLSGSYEESAKLDGASPLVILFKILLPLVKPTIVVIIMFTVISQWNSWYTASIYLPRRRDLWPLQLFMREMLIQNDTSKIVTSAGEANALVNMTGNLVKYCVTIAGTLPILCAYPFAQKYFVTGITLGGVKE